MKKLKVNYHDHDFKIGLNDTLFSIGSCFSNEVSSFLKDDGLYIMSNPFGTVYNIYSIYKILERLILEKEYIADDLFHEDDIYFTMDHSTLFDNSNSEKCLEKIYRNFKKAVSYLKKTTVIIITPGTSVVWEYQNRIIANCHKLPDKLFKKRILSYIETIDILKKIIYIIRDRLKKVKIIFTLSPVRHNPADLQTNSFSKAILRAGIGSVVDNKNVYYFPSYEIMMDELRDYSYYKGDMNHLKSSAVNYIIDKFKSNFFDNKLLDYLKKFKSAKKESLHMIKDFTTKKTLFFIDRLVNNLNTFEKIKENPLVDKLKINAAKKIIKTKNDVYKKERLLFLFGRDTKIYDFFVSIVDKDYEKLKNFNLKDRELNKIKNQTLLKYFFK
ncbi:MAG: GSCFA domain-containing protein [Spirochaetes bacterium]|nr:GSCFA domain-containing protein [Spirochaetota bacterium]